MKSTQRDDDGQVLPLGEMARCECGSLLSALLRSVMCLELPM